MTNEELLAAIRLIVREELAGLGGGGSGGLVPDDEIVDGPDEDGRVKFAATKKVNKNVKVLSVLTVKQAAAGRIPALSERQLATLMMNVGCDREGNLQPVGPGRLYGQTGKPEVDQMSPMANKVTKNPTWWQPNRWDFAEPFQQSNSDRTISSRSEDIDTLVASVEGLGLLGVNDGSGFRIP